MTQFHDSGHTACVKEQLVNVVVLLTQPPARTERALEVTPCLLYVRLEQDHPWSGIELAV